jgi:cation transport ATPase
VSNSIQTPLNDVVKRSLGAVVAADVHLVGGEVLLDQSMLNSESVPIEAGAGVQTYAGHRRYRKGAFAGLNRRLHACRCVTAFAVVADLVKVPAFRRLGILGPCLLPKG